MIGAYLSDLLYSFPLCIIAMMNLCPLFTPEEDVPICFLVTVSSLLLTNLFVHVKLRGKLCIAAVLIAVTLGVIFTRSSDTRIDFIVENYCYGLAFLLGIASYLSGRAVSIFRSVRLFAGAAAVCALLFILFTDYAQERLCVAMLFLLPVLATAQEIQHHWKKSGYTDGRKHIAYIYPFIIAAVLMTVITPAPDEPYDWPVTRRLWQLASDAVTKISQYFSNDEDPLEAVLGFSETGSFLNSQLDESADPINEFKISFRMKNTPSLNIAASSYNTFDNLHWTNTASSDTNGHLLDLIETRTSLLAKNVDDINDYCRSIEAAVSYDKLYTRYLLMPAKSSLAVHSTVRHSDITDENGFYSFKDKHGHGTDYTFSYQRMNKYHEAFARLFDEPSEFTASDWNRVEPTFPSAETDKVRLSYEDYLAHKEAVYSDFLSPVEVSDRLRSVLDELYAGAKNPYEKMLLLEEALGNLNYTLSPGAFPDDIATSTDFLDYFLLSSRSGYCSHFATAMTLLARAEGLPSRYVQGFHINASNTSGLTITNNNAHAWVEIYFEGFGFIPFDPTPGHASREYWDTASERRDYRNSLSKGSAEAFLNYGDEDEDVLSQEEIITESQHISPSMIIIPVVLVILFYAAAVILHKFLVRRRFKRLCPRERAIELCRRAVKILGFFGYTLTNDKTLEEFEHEMQKEESFHEIYYSFIPLYERLLYSSYEVSDKDTEELQTVCDSLCSAGRRKHKILFMLWQFTRS